MCTKYSQTNKERIFSVLITYQSFLILNPRVLPSLITILLLLLFFFFFFFFFSSSKPQKTMAENDPFCYPYHIDYCMPQEKWSKGLDQHSETLPRNSRKGAGSTSEKPLDAKTLRHLAQNREAARKSHLWKKAYVQQLE
ncbi:transcription factor TGA10-like [Arachis hypogaea]|uniref:transcription factor TGA10-like n=1 Tax=Arachis hypogaea TaxID=3818 RepID=UPI003B21E4A5